MRKFQLLRLTGLFYSLLFPELIVQAQAVDQPLNVIVIVTDDQGYGDYGFMGNAHVRTPHLDRLAAASPQVERFYVSPVCSPTRAALMTGRYAYRSGLIATNTGQSEMDTGETTLAEVFRASGYFTGIYGKWHLGDHYPRRPQDQGFEESLIHRGGGLGQPSEPPENQRRYTDPILFHNGEKVETTGYCTDVYFNYAREALDRAQSEARPFFICIATNAPHDPYHDVPPGPYGYYQSLGDELTDFPHSPGDYPIIDQGKKNAPDRLARIYAMEENIDTNVGGLMAYLQDHGLIERTLVVFFSDNGGLGRRYSAGLRGEKGEVYEGGIRSPLLMALPGRLSHSTRFRVPTAHIDLFPTLLDACGLGIPPDLALDGFSLWPMLTGMEPETAFAARTLFLQSHVGNRPDLYRNMAVIRGDWKLVSNTHHLGRLPEGEPPLELFNLARDPNETTNLIAGFPETADSLALAYENWFYDATARRFGPKIIDLDADTGETVVLTQQDRWFEQTPDWTRERGDWRVQVRTTGDFRLQPLMRHASDKGPVQLWIPELAEQPFCIPDGGEQDSGLTLLFNPGVYTIRATAVLDGMTRPLHQLAIARAEPAARPPMEASVKRNFVDLGILDGEFYRNTAVLDRTLPTGGMMEEIPEWMTKTDFPYHKKPFDRELPFADAATVVRLLGGWKDGTLPPDRRNDENDLAGRAADGTIFYRWDLLKARLDPYIAQGYELTLVMDNIPYCFPQKPAQGTFGQAVPPADFVEWEVFLRAMCLELKRLYGAETANRLRFRMGTEMQDQRRFQGPIEDYLKYYDHAAKAVKEVLPGARFGPFNRSMPHGNFDTFDGLVSGNVGILEVAEHCANGTNYATGETGSPLDFLARSFYYFSSEPTPGKFSNIQPDQRLPEFKQLWEAVENVSPKFANLSREVHEYGPHLQTEQGIYGPDTGARGAAQNLDTLIGLREIGVDRVWHWRVFEDVARGKTLVMSNAWLYCVLDRMRGGRIYSLPVEAAESTGNRCRSLLSVKDDEAILVVAHWNPDRTRHDQDQLGVEIPHGLLPAAMKPSGLLSLSEENSVYDVIRVDLRDAGLLSAAHLSHPGEPATVVSKGGSDSMAADKRKGKALVSRDWKKYQALMRDSLTLKPFSGSRASDSGYVSFEAACPSVTVILFKP